ncbi:MAG: enoyl-ACP reductase FabI [Candidatus Sumerlaeia bacterium]
MTNILEGRKIVVMGLRNKWSLAWGIAQSVQRFGGELILTCQGEREQLSIQKLFEEEGIGHMPVYPCDVSKDEELERTFQQIGEKHGTIHGLAHCIAFANTKNLREPFVNTGRDDYLLAQNISVYSLLAAARAAAPLMKDGGAIVTLSFLGGERVVPNYNVMGVCKAALESTVRYLAGDMGPAGIRVYAISAGPVKTLAAKAIGDFDTMLEYVRERAPLRRATDIGEVGDTAAFLFSDMARGITGETIYVDCGYHILG